MFTVDYVSESQHRHTRCRLCPLTHGSVVSPSVVTAITDSPTSVVDQGREFATLELEKQLNNICIEFSTVTTSGDAVTRQLVADRHAEQCNGLLGGALQPLSHDEVDGVPSAGGADLSPGTGEQFVQDVAVNLAAAISNFGVPGAENLMSAIGERVSSGSRSLALQDTLATFVYSAPAPEGGSASASSALGLVTPQLPVRKRFIRVEGSCYGCLRCSEGVDSTELVFVCPVCAVVLCATCALAQECPGCADKRREAVGRVDPEGMKAVIRYFGQILRDRAEEQEGVERLPISVSEGTTCVASFSQAVRTPLVLADALAAGSGFGPAQGAKQHLSVEEMAPAQRVAWDRTSVRPVPRRLLPAVVGEADSPAFHSGAVDSPESPTVSSDPDTQRCHECKINCDALSCMRCSLCPAACCDAD